MSYSNVEINFAAQEPEGPTGRGRRESRQTAKMGDYGTMTRIFYNGTCR